VLYDLGQTLARQNRDAEAAVCFRKFVDRYGELFPDLRREAERTISGTRPESAAPAPRRPSDDRRPAPRRP